MRRPGKGVTSVALALIVAAVGGAVLSRSLHHSDAASKVATQQTVLFLLNHERRAHGLAPLMLDARLEQAARSHSADMLQHGYFAHDGRQGAWDTRVRRYVTSPLLGEVLEFGTGTYATAGGMVSAWMHSPAHRRVILTPALRRVGLGILTGTYRGETDVTMATGDFSSG
jgi:uncharacterized protein YkwD